MLQWSAMFIDHCIFWRQYWMFITHCILCRNLVFWKKYCMIEGLTWLWREDCTATGVGCPSLQGFGITNQFTNRKSTHIQDLTDFQRFPISCAKKLSNFLPERNKIQILYRICCGCSWLVAILTIQESGIEAGPVSSVHPSIQSATCLKS
jgi:hypothetical protein